MRRTVITLGLSLLGLSAFGQSADSTTVVDSAVVADSVFVDTTWERGADIALTLSQVGVSNWAGGGASSLSTAANFHVFANMTKPNLTWENDLQVGYGIIREGGRENAFRKNNDLVIFTSRYGQKLNKRWKISGVIDFRTQVANGYRYDFVDSLDRDVATKISSFMAPGYLIPSLGVTYSRKKILKVTYAPVTGKFTFVMDEFLASQGAFGVEEGEMFRRQFGSSLTANFQKKFTDDIEFRTNILFFADYRTITEVDVNWEAYLMFRVNKWLTSNITSQLIYDKDIDITRDDGTVGPAVQLRNVINVGIAIDFWTKE